MKAYKGFHRHGDGTLWCRRFQYEVGKTYTFEGKPVLCREGFHACHEPWQCWVFYPNNGRNVYYEVECGGKIVESGIDDGKFVCTEITLVREIPAPENKFDYCYFFHNGYAIVGLDGKYNFIDTKGKYISKQWFDCCDDFCDGYAEVRLDGKCNWIDTEGQIISEQWFDWCWNFRDGYVKVRLNDKWNHINTDGKLLSEQWWDDCGYFQDGYAIVKFSGKYNYINTDGKLISKQWFDDCWDFHNGYARVGLNGKYYTIDKNGKIMEE